jgi:hypothetical protein
MAQSRRRSPNWPDPASRIRVLAEYAELTLSNGQVAIIDIEDVALVSQRCWCAKQTSDRIYIHAAYGGKKVWLHRLIAGAGPGDTIDHKDRDTLNCRRSNLRFATRSQNGGNCRISVRNTSGYKGVTRDRRKWMAQIGVGRSNIRLGSFSTAEEAAAAYDAAALKYFGEFAAVNADIAA